MEIGTGKRDRKRKRKREGGGVRETFRDKLN